MRDYRYSLVRAKALDRRVIKLPLLLITTLLLVLGNPVQAQSYAQHISSQLSEAEAYLTVNPSRSLQLLDQIGPIVQPTDLALKRHILLMRAAVPTGQIDRILPALDIVFNYQHELEFLRQLTAVHSAAGIWLRKNHYLTEAKLSFACAEKYASNDKQRLTLLNSIGLLHRELNEYDAARAQFARALALAESSKQTSVLAMVQNNLGLLALDEGNLANAAHHFHTALQHYQVISQRSGQISAGLNLMLVSLLLPDTQQYQRLYAPTATLTNHFSNQAKQALLLWLHTYFQHLQGITPQADTQLQLTQAFYLLDDQKISQLIRQRVAPALQITLPASPAETKKTFDRPWFSKVQACSWPTLTGSDEHFVFTLR